MYRQNGILMVSADEVDTAGLDPFAVQLASTLGLYFPAEGFQLAIDRNEFLQKQILQEVGRMREKAIAYSWATNPDRMGQ